MIRHLFGWRQIRTMVRFCRRPAPARWFELRDPRTGRLAGHVRHLDRDEWLVNHDEPRATVWEQLAARRGYHIDRGWRF
jgi:hypothetical protein